jgi:hypothetical protein
MRLARRAATNRGGTAYRMSVKLIDMLSFIWEVVLAAIIACAAYSHSALSAPIPVWAVLNSEKSDLPNGPVSTLALGPAPVSLM